MNISSTDLTSYAALIGIDWADKKHDVCLQLPGSLDRELSVLPHKVAAIDAWARGLRERFGGRPVAVCLELSQGPIVSALLNYDFFVIFPVQPKALANYRRTFTTSGAKDDPTDAEFAVDFLTKHPEALAPLRPERVEIRTLQRLVQDRRDFVHDTTRVTNRLTYALKAYFPQVLDWFGDKNTLVFCDFLTRWPTLRAAQAESDDTLATFFRDHNLRYRHIIAERIRDIRAQRPLTEDPGIVEPNLLTVATLVAQLRPLIAAVAGYDRRIAKLCEQVADFRLFDCLPGAGPTLAPRLLAAFGETRERFVDAAAVQKYVGIAPVTERSGKKHWVHWRWACPKFIRQTFVEWAGESVTRSFWARAFYDHQRQKGASRNAALRALAFKWIRILYRCWVDRVPYDESAYLSSLQRRRSPLIQFIAAEAAA
jgi:transposase